MLIQATLVTSFNALCHFYAYTSTKNYTEVFNPPDWQWHLKYFFNDCTACINPLIYLALNTQLQMLFVQSICCRKGQVSTDVTMISVRGKNSSVK